MAMTIPPPPAGRAPIDDYHVERDPGQQTRPVTHHLLAWLKGFLLIVLAALSFALFWVVATLLGVV